MTTHALDSEVASRLEDVYRDLHSHPELSFAEHRTAGIAAAWLREWGFEVHEAIGGTGVVGVMSRGGGPVVLLRADMDGLPVEESTGLPYASTSRGVDPDGIAAQVLDAILTDRFWILTHPEMRQAPVERMQRAAAQENPA